MKVATKILVVAAHPDDEVFGCGGLLIRKSQEGSQIRVVFLGDGVSSRPGTEGALQKREEEARKAARVLGVQELFFLRFPDNRLDTIPLLDLVRKVEEHLDDFKPQWVLTHYWGDLNVDHRKAHEAVMTACRPLPGSGVEKILCLEVPSSTEWSTGKASDIFCPNLFVSIETVLRQKLDALSAYTSELRPYPHPRSIEGVTAMARRWGTVAGCEAAEAFVVVRELWNL